jgi:CheY-like chemotaxis protein
MSIRELVSLGLDIVKTLIWPVVVLVIAFSFRRTIRDRISQSEEFVLTGPGGMGITARGRVEAADALVRASQPSGGIDRQEAFERVGEVVRAVGDFGRSPRILWVDDRPSNNTYERQAMEKIGMAFELSTSTDDALAKIKLHGPYDVIISDMGRPPDDRAGYTLLDRLRSEGDRTPFVIYASSRSQEHFDESVRRGAVGCTNRPSELIDLVRRALRVA